MLRQLISDLYSGAIDPCSRDIDKTTKRYAQDRATADLADEFRKILTRSSVNSSTTTSPNTTTWTP